MLCFFATLLSKSKSGIEKSEFAIVSTYIALVLLSIRDSSSSSVCSLPNLIWIQSLGNVTLNWLYVPPYSENVLIILSPASQIF